jgi:hypothetical protein
MLRNNTIPYAPDPKTISVVLSEIPLEMMAIAVNLRSSDTCIKLHSSQTLCKSKAEANRLAQAYAPYDGPKANTNGMFIMWPNNIHKSLFTYTQSGGKKFPLRIISTANNCIVALSA